MLHTSDPFQAIADPSRREILRLLKKNNLTVSALAENFDISRPAVSKHIKILYSAGFIVIEDLGRERRCSLKKSGFNEVQEWIEDFDTFWNARLDSLEKYLNKKGPSKLKTIKK